ncbi:hypothetical protein HOO65_060333 [Ceratocystis lukuohia]|uniref:Myb-like domain-containing protein n=1 Tax=Ceratocystis lukuohia TaxID=2019550 RepID=A0ABR4ME06_9PEZI
MVFESCQISSPASTPTLQAIATRRDRKAAIRHTGNYKAGAKPSISSLILRSQSIDKDCGKYSPAGSKTETQKSSSFPRKMEKHWYSYAGSCDLEMEDNSSDVFIKKEGMYLTDSGPLTPNAMDHCDPLDIKPAVFSIGFNSDLHEDMMWDQKSGAEVSLNADVKSHLIKGETNCHIGLFGRNSGSQLELGTASNTPTLYSQSSTGPDTPYTVVDSPCSSFDSNMGGFAGQDMTFPQPLDIGYSSMQDTSMLSAFSRNAHQSDRGPTISPSRMRITPVSSPPVPAPSTSSSCSFSYLLNEQTPDLTPEQPDQYPVQGQNSYSQAASHHNTYDPSTLGGNDTSAVSMPYGRKSLPELAPKVIPTQPSQPMESIASPFPAPEGNSYPQFPGFEISPTWSPAVREGRAYKVSRAQRRLQDAYLVQAKLSGMTYREIRLRGNFSEAESTLRGRFRTLTKNKEWRVRKPHWFPRDIDLLREGVEYFCDQRSIDQGKIPWKRVAEYILQNGGSYLFGNATCRKKWDEMMYYGMF